MKIKLLWAVAFLMAALTLVLWFRTDGLSLMYKKGNVIILETVDNQSFGEGEESRSQVKVFTGGKVAELKGTEGVRYEKGEVIEAYSYSGKYYAAVEQARNRLLRAIFFYLSAFTACVLCFVAGSTMDWGKVDEDIWLKLDSIASWESYLKKEDLSIDLYSQSPSGYYWEKQGDNFVFGYAERRKKEVLAEFKTEKKLVRHLYHYFSKDPEYRKKVVMVCYYKDRVDEVDNILKADRIHTVREEKPDLNGDMIYYLYVYGKDRCKLAKEYRQTRYI